MVTVVFFFFFNVGFVVTTISAIRQLVKLSFY
jgi:hypothetical protein